MVRTWRLIAAVALLGVLAVLAFPADGSAYRGMGISLTAAGASPSVLTMPVGMYPVWFNSDTVTHTVGFANGLCSFQVAPGGFGRCARRLRGTARELPVHGGRDDSGESRGRCRASCRNAHREHPHGGAWRGAEAAWRTPHSDSLAARAACPSARHRSGATRPLPRIPPRQSRHRNDSRLALAVATAGPATNARDLHRGSEQPAVGRSVLGARLEQAVQGRGSTPLSFACRSDSLRGSSEHDRAADHST